MARIQVTSFKQFLVYKICFIINVYFQVSGKDFYAWNKARKTMGYFLVHRKIPINKFKNINLNLVSQRYPNSSSPR